MRTSEWVSKWFTRNGKTLGLNHKGIELFIKLDHRCHSLVRSLGTQLLNCERNIFSVMTTIVLRFMCFAWLSSLLLLLSQNELPQTLPPSKAEKFSKAKEYILKVSCAGWLIIFSVMRKQANN